MTGILIIARLGSTRLNSKHLIKVNGKTLIEYLAERMATEFATETGKGLCKIIIATSDLPENREFENVFAGSATEVFYGDNGNIPLRQLQCTRHFNLSEIISVDGDDILCSTHGARLILEKLTAPSPARIARTTGLPLGMNIMGYQVSYLNECLAGVSEKTMETGWGRIFEEKDMLAIPLGDYSQQTNLRMTLDYAQDAEFFSAVINAAGNNIFSITDEALISLILEKGYEKINGSLNEEYWLNFKRQSAKEIENEKK